MIDQLMRVYRHLPAPLRSAAASARGLYLQHWRDGPLFEQHRLEALERDRWSRERLRAYEDERLARVLERAATRVPYYRAAWAERRRRGDHAAVDVLANWPVLEKDRLRQNPHAFVADDCDANRMFHERTSGTTGKPLEIWRSRAGVTELYALMHARTLDWHGISRETRWARLGGQLVVGAARQRPPFWVWNGPMHQLYMSTFHLSPQLIPHYLDALVEYRIEYLAAYTSSLVALAHGALARRPRLAPMRAVFTNAEGVDAGQRALIEEAFQCPVRESYGQTEMVCSANECEAGRLHLWPEAGVVEVHDQGAAVPLGTTGEFVCTGVLNPDMPLIRYRVGDRGALAPAHERCACGRELALIKQVEGRTNDLVVTSDGVRVFWLNPAFYGMPLRESQIEQHTRGHLVVRLVPGEGFVREEVERTIGDRLRDRVGDMTIEFLVVDAIERTANGKLRAVICTLPTDLPALADSVETAPRVG